MRDLTRDDIARLAVETQNIDTLATAFDHLAKAIPNRVTRGVLERATETLRAKMTGLRDRMPALLALATEALDRREGLHFVRVAAITARPVWRALAVDGRQYEIRKLDEGVYEWNAATPMGDLNRATSFTEAIEKARAHDRARRGGK